MAYCPPYHCSVSNGVLTLARTLRTRRWTLAPQHANAVELADALKMSPLVAQVLVNRGIDTPDAARLFLRPTLMQLHEPRKLGGLPVAAERIARAVRDREKIVIYGDYDVDGITATSILWHAITRLGGLAETYIPHRIDEGYGLNAEAVADICSGGARLIITVDCGVTAIGPAAVAAERGVDLIITDHHEWHSASDSGRPQLPQCLAVVHPRLPNEAGEPYPNPYLCGAGVAFKLAWGIGTAVNGRAKVGDDFRAFLVDATAFAALGTIADVVPLVGENRVLAANGLGGLKQSRLNGIRALIESASLTGHTLDSYDVGFKLGPRLNACGRMGHAKLAVEMMTTATPQRAKEIADFLEQQNRERQAMERHILEQAIEQARALGCEDDDCDGVVLAAEGWHAGVIGIVASRIVERLHRPTVMIALRDGIGQGSARSVPGFHLANALAACTEHLTGHGGHEMAAGLKMHPDHVAAFRLAFCEHAKAMLTPEQRQPALHLDATVSLSQLSEAVVVDLHRMAPFGQGNRRPILFCPGVTVAAPPRKVGRSGDHLQLFVRQGEMTMKAIAFGCGEAGDIIHVGAVLDLAVEAGLNEWNGRRSVELEVKDFRPAQSATARDTLQVPSPTVLAGRNEELVISP